jgi:hypothetical protein
VKPTLEEGWTTLIDGLHIHRYYLQVQPARDRHIEALYAAAYGAGVPELDELRRRFGEAVLEHLLHPAQPEPLTAASPTAPGPLGVVVDEDVTEPGEEPAAIRASAVGGPAKAMPDGTADFVRDSMRTAGLDYLLELCAEVVVLTDARRPPGQRDGHAPWGTVRVARDDSPLRQATLIAGAAARQLFTCFARSGGAGATGTLLRSPVTGEEGDAEQVGADIIDAAVQWRYLDAMSRAEAEGQVEADRAWSARRLDELTALLPGCVEALPGLQKAIDHPNTYDVVASLVPGEHRFEGRYRGGGGLGQH